MIVSTDYSTGDGQEAECEASLMGAGNPNPEPEMEVEVFTLPAGIILRQLLFPCT